MDGWRGAGGLVALGRDPQRKEAGADASCSRGAAGIPCRNFEAKLIWV